MNDWLILLQAKLDKAKSKASINSDIEKIQKEIDKLKIQAEFSPETISNLTKQLEGILGQKIVISDIEINQAQAVKTAQRTGEQIGNAISQGVENSASKVNKTLRSFSELRVGKDTKFNIEFDEKGLVNAEETLRKIKETYSEFGQVKITNEIFDSGKLNEFKVNIKQVNGDLKETRSFMVSLSEDEQFFIPVDNIVKGSESIVHHLDEAKNATNKIITEEEKLAEQMARVREKTELARQSEEKRQQSAQNNAINKALEEEYAEREKLAEQVNKILKDTGDKGNTTTAITLLRDNFTKLGLSVDEVKNNMAGVDKEFSLLKDTIATGDNNAIVSQFDKLNTVLSQTQNDLKTTRSEYSQLVSAQQRLNKANAIKSWNLRNSKATREVRSANEAYITSLRDLNTQMTRMQFNEIVNGFKRAENSMRGIHRLGASVKDQFNKAFQTISQTMSVVHVVRSGLNYVRQMPSIVTELDTALVDLRKTAKMSAEELKDFYYSSNDVAKQMGVTTKEILEQAAAWSRLN